MLDNPSFAKTIRDVPYMGVIYVVWRASQLGFYNGHPDWSNLGQGQPEVGEMDGAPPRFSEFRVLPEDHAYGPINGTDELRDTIAEHYNRLYRQGKVSRYTRDNVAVASGGRLMLTRLVAAVNNIRLGYQVPDYTAYEDLLGYHRERLEFTCIEGREDDGFAVPADRFQQEVHGHHLQGFLFSNPCNPTGNVIAGEALDQYVQTCRATDCLLLSDEFYSHFIYTDDGPGAGPVSAAAYVEDVNRDPVIAVDGLTKSFRYPGWRLGWAVGPRYVIEQLGRSASAIDGGPSMPIQRAAVEVLQPARADQETTALRRVFAKKRNITADRLAAIGIRFANRSRSTFYAWGDLTALPEPLNEADVFFEEALKRRVMTVPGRFFDIRLGQRRAAEHAYRSWMRFSFGPPEDNLIQGLDRLEEMVESFS